MKLITTTDDLAAFCKPLAETETETTWMKQLRAWVRDVLGPRARATDKRGG